MRAEPIITRIVVDEFEWELHDIGLDPTGAIPTYRPGDTVTRRAAALRIYTDVGIVGEFAGWPTVEGMTLPLFTHALLGRRALQRERVYRDLKPASRPVGRSGMGVVASALWDIAGQFHGAPTDKLLGGSR